ncbi:MAG: sulfurtransferase TusA family protein [Verrucomicrobiales bacterium]|nr:sulfurtransferase TusA family protein [Verrucomicrobiales bacterium]
MSNKIHIDARGMKCPRPIIELAKAKRRNVAGTTIHIEADDLAFESDVKAWCETTGNRLDALSRNGDLVLADITLQ